MCGCPDIASFVPSKRNGHTATWHPIGANEYVCATGSVPAHRNGRLLLIDWIGWNITVLRTIKRDGDWNWDPSSCVGVFINIPVEATLVDH